MADCAPMRFALVMLLSMAALNVPASTRQPTRIFISGHSLTDKPIPPYLSSIAQSLGNPVLWNRQYAVGSSIKYRTRGPSELGWAGYAMGLDRDGTQSLNVIEEFKHPKTTDGQPYDALIITEQHGVLDSLVFNDTLRYLRHYHDRFIDGNPKGRTYFYEPWLGVPDKSQPQRWIAYERAASPLWQCVVTRINLALEAEGRSDRLVSLPAGLAMAELADRATSAPGVAGLTAPTVRETMDRIFRDDVHPTPLGAYYAALVSYAFVFDRSPVGAWFPAEISAEQAGSLQRVADHAVARYRAENKPWPLERCREAVRGPFSALYFDHTRDTYWASIGSSFKTTLKRWRQRLAWHWHLWRHHGGDPFHSAREDQAYWLAGNG